MTLKNGMYWTKDEILYFIISNDHWKMKSGTSFFNLTLFFMMRLILLEEYDLLSDCGFLASYASVTPFQGKSKFWFS